MSVYTSPAPRQQYLDLNGNPYIGGKLFTYAAGSTTKQNTYTTSAGDVANSNPILLDAEGRTPYEVRFTSGLLYKLVLASSTDTDPPASGILLGDNLSGVNDTASTQISQWVSTSSTPTYISTTSFSVIGDQTSIFSPGRRIKITVSSGTVYGIIITSVYSSVTTITVLLDSGAIDAGISALEVGILTYSNTSNPGEKRVLSSRTSNTILSESDSGTFIEASGTFTQTLLAASILGKGWYVIYRDLSGVIIFDPDGTELINGLSTYSAFPGDTLIITCDGIGFSTNNITQQYYSNIIMNADFSVWQDRTIYAAAPTGAYTADGWKYEKAGAVVHTVQASTDAPSVAQSGNLFKNSITLDVTTVDAAIGASDFCMLNQSIEGYNFLSIAQVPFILSFWVKDTKTGIHCVSFRNLGHDRSYVSEYTINSSDTWEYKVIYVPASPAAGTWDYVNGVGLTIAWALSAGSSFQTTAGSWNTGNFLATANQVNATDSTSNKFLLEGVQLNQGNVAINLQRESIQDNYARCQRYFWKGLPCQEFSWAAYATSSVLCLPVSFPVKMRAAPTMTIDDASSTYSGITFSAVGNSTLDGCRYTVSATAANINCKITFGANDYIAADARL